MAFVNEKYPSEEKARIDALVETRPPLTRSPGLSSWWTVDRDRDACLVFIGSEGGAYEGTPETEHYVLVIGEHEIRFAGRYQVQGQLRNGEPQVIAWNISQFSIPSDLASQREEVLALVREALDTLGLHYSRRNVASVIVNFDSALTR